MPAGVVTAGPAAPGAFAAPGWYGKLSVLGDFAQRRLAPGVVQRVDAWLSGWIVASRAQLGDRWLDAYLRAPLLRFAWTPGVVGPLWWFGVLMPSCDRTGRYFPLWVADPRPAAPSGRIGWQRLDAWFDHIATAATATLDDAASVEAFEQALAVVPAGPDADVPAHARPPRWAAVLGGDGPAAGVSCWWAGSAGGGEGPPTVLTGLPAAADLTRLLLARPPPGIPGA